MGQPYRDRFLKGENRSARRRGWVVSIGFTGGKEPAPDVVDLIVNEKSLVGYSLHAETDAEVSRALLELGPLAANGQLKPIIDSSISIEDFKRGRKVGLAGSGVDPATSGLRVGGGRQPSPS